MPVCGLLELLRFPLEFGDAIVPVTRHSGGSGNGGTRV